MTGLHNNANEPDEDVANGLSPSQVIAVFDERASAIRAFFEPIRSLEDVLAAFRAKEKRPYVRCGVDSYPQHQLALAFLLAKLGSRTAAVEALEQFTKHFEIGESEAHGLRGLLERCS